MGIRADFVMQAAAFRRGYDIPDHVRQGIIQTAWEIIQDPNSKKREKISAMKVVLAADKVDHEIKKSDREVELALLALAESQDIKDDVLRIIETTKSGTDSPINIEEQK
jgi:hypothetical protein